MRQFTIVTLTKNLGHNLFSFIFITCHIIRLFQFNFLNHSPVYALSILPVLPWVMLWALICPLFTNHSKKLIFFFFVWFKCNTFSLQKKKKNRRLQTCGTFKVFVSCKSTSPRKKVNSFLYILSIFSIHTNTFSMFVYAVSLIIFTEHIIVIFSYQYNLDTPHYHNYVIFHFISLRSNL